MKLEMYDDYDVAMVLGILLAQATQKYPGRPFLKIIQDAADFTGQNIWNRTLNNQSLVKMLEKYLNTHD